MLRYVLYLGVVFLLIDHIYTHWGPEIVNRVASGFLGREVTVVEEPPHRESVIDKMLKEVRERVNRLRR